MKHDVALIIGIATLAIAFVCWTAFFAIHWVGEARRSNESNKALSEFINQTLRPFVDEAKELTNDHRDNR